MYNILFALYDKDYEGIYHTFYNGNMDNFSSEEQEYRMQATDNVLVSSLAAADKVTNGYLSLFFITPELSEMNEEIRSTMPVAPANKEISEKVKAFQKSME